MYVFLKIDFHATALHRSPSGRLSAVVHLNSTIYNHVGNHLVTCPYCILWTDTSVTRSPDGATKEGRNLYLFSKSMSRFWASYCVGEIRDTKVALVPQQSLGRCRSPTWRSLSTRLRVSTSRLNTTLETLQVRSSSSSSFSSCAADDLLNRSEWPELPVFQICALKPTAQRMKTNERKPLGLPQSFSLQTQEQPRLLFYSSAVFMYALCRFQ